MLCCRMPKTQHSLDDLIANALRWTYDTKKRAFYATLPGGRMSDPLRKFALIKKDPRLYDVLRYITMQVRDDANALRITMALWADKQPWLGKLDAGTRRYVTQIHAFRGYAQGGHVWLNVTYSDIETRPDGTLYATGRGDTRELRFDPSQLESHYPGCTQRLTHAITLGMAPEEIAEHVFCHGAPVEPVLLPACLCQDEYAP